MPNVADGWDGFFGGTGAGELQVLLVSFFTLPCSHPVLARPVFRPMQQQSGLSAVAGPFAKVRLPQPGEDGKFFVVAVLR